jgi:hypothetical protein
MNAPSPGHVNNNTPPVTKSRYSTPTIVAVSDSKSVSSHHHTPQIELHSDEIEGSYQQNNQFQDLSSGVAVSSSSSLPLSASPFVPGSSTTYSPPIIKEIEVGPVLSYSPLGNSVSNRPQNTSSVNNNNSTPSDVSSSSSSSSSSATHPFVHLSVYSQPFVPHFLTGQQALPQPSSGLLSSFTPSPLPPIAVETPVFEEHSISTEEVHPKKHSIFTPSSISSSSFLYPPPSRLYPPPNTLPSSSSSSSFDNVSTRSIPPGLTDSSFEDININNSKPVNIPMVGPGAVNLSTAPMNHIMNLALDSHHSKKLNNDLGLYTSEERFHLFKELYPHVTFLMKDKVWVYV